MMSASSSARGDLGAISARSRVHLIARLRVEDPAVDLMAHLQLLGVLKVVE